MRVTVTGKGLQIRKFFLIGSAAMSLFAVGCPSPRAVCESDVAMACERAFECASDQEKSSDDFKAENGTSVAECKTKLASDVKCAEMKDFTWFCGSGTYNYDKAAECDDAKKAQSCADFYTWAKSPPACSQICTYK